jgi:hypothetical protein
VRVRFHWWGGLLVVGLALAASARADEIVVGASGRAFVVSPGAAVRVRSAAPGAPFGPWRTVVRAGRDERVMDAGVAADGSGVAVLESAARALQVAAFAPRGRVERPVALSSDAGGADFAASAVAPSGAAIVVWFRHRDDGRWRLEASVRDAGGAAFGRAEPISRFVRRPCCTGVSTAIGDRGHAVVAWSSTSYPAVWAALRAPGRGFRRVQRLTRSASGAPKAVVGAGGTAAVIYSTQHVPLRASDGLQLHRAGGGSFGPAEHVNPGGGVTTGDVAVAPSGDVIVAWADKVHGTRVHVSDAAAGGPLSVAAELGSEVSLRAVAVANDASGRAVVAWSQRAASDGSYREQAEAATRGAAGAPFGPPTALGRPWRAAEPQQVRLIPGAGALVLWKGSRYDGPTARRTALAVTRLP